MTININKEKVIGAIVVLENYLDGALADFEEGSVDNTDIIEDCIYVHKKLELVYNPFLSFMGDLDDYEKRYFKEKDKRKKEKK